MTTARTPSDPGALDGLAEQSTAMLAELPDGPVPTRHARPPAGWWADVDGRGVFLRRTEGSPAAGPVVASAGNGAVVMSDASVADRPPDAWYVHGLAGSSTNWTSLAGLLSDRARGFLVDLPGHGRSDPPPRGRYRLADDAMVLAALIEEQSGAPVHLVGNSLGGMVSVELAARRPDLVATLTLISPAVPDLRLTTDRGADPRLAVLLLPGTSGLAHRRLAGIPAAQRVTGMLELCFGDPAAVGADELEAATADLAWRLPLPWVHAATVGSLRGLMSSYLRTPTTSFRAAATRISCPTLVIWGTRDRLVDPRLARRTAAAFPSADLLVLPGIGHTAQLEDPVTVARAVIALWDGAGAPHSYPEQLVAASSL